jgi:hypothetical protein
MNNVYIHIKKKFTTLSIGYVLGVLPLILGCYNLTLEVKPIKILDQNEKELRNKKILMLKVL